MTYIRHEHTCNLITEPFPQIVIVGGHPHLTSVEILNLETNKLTKGKLTMIMFSVSNISKIFPCKGPNLPSATYTHFGIVRNNKLLIMGGTKFNNDDKKIYE